MALSWSRQRQTTILDTLHAFQNNPFNPTDAPMTMTSLVTCLGICAEEVAMLCRALVDAGLVEAVDAGYRLTDLGEIVATKDFVAFALYVLRRP